MLRVVGKVEFSTYDTACKTAFANRYDVVYDRKTGVSLGPSECQKQICKQQIKIVLIEFLLLPQKN